MIKFSCFIIFLLIQVSIENDECQKNCEGTRFGCKTKLLKSSGEQESGVYKLNQDYINLTCLFESLPRLVDIKWKFKPDSDILNIQKSLQKSSNYGNEMYRKLKCDQLKFSHDCKGGADGHLSFSNCILKLNDIRMSGYYKCDAVNPSTGQTLAEGINTKVRVIGIQSIDVVETRLISGHSGFVEVKICANSVPSISWIIDSTILQPGESKTRYSSSQYSKYQFHNMKETNETMFVKAKDRENIDPFCNYVQLFISNVEEEIENLQIGVQNDSGYYIKNLNLKMERKNDTNVFYKVSITFIVFLTFFNCLMLS
uniref:Ig-like domain-containing protein n=1 Tax=Parastrongyloides trichosuri TaxID=131310 RepID=A0A0N4ZUU8_PARTI